MSGLPLQLRPRITLSKSFLSEVSIALCCAPLVSSNDCVIQFLAIRYNATLVTFPHRTCRLPSSCMKCAAFPSGAFGPITLSALAPCGYRRVTERIVVLSFLLQILFELADCLRRVPVFVLLGASCLARLATTAPPFVTALSIGPPAATTNCGIFAKIACSSLSPVTVTFTFTLTFSLVSPSTF